MGKKITLSTLAAECGVSIGTVDRALKDRAGINPQTKELIVAAAARLGYVGPEKAKGNGGRIAFISPSVPAGFYSIIKSGFDGAAARIAKQGFEAEYISFDPRTPESQLQLLDTLDIRQYCGIAINPYSVKCQDFVDRCTREGTPVVTFNNDLPHSSRLFYVGTDSEQCGRMAADIMSMLIGGSGSIAVIGNFVHVMPFFERFGGFCEFIRENTPGITVYSASDCRLDDDVTEKNICQLLSATPDLKGIFCTGYSSTTGALRAMKKIGIDNIAVVGFDVDSETASAVADGRCKVLLYQDPYQQGYQALTLLARHLESGWIPPVSRLVFEPRVVIRSNVGNYIRGMGSWDVSVKDI